MDDSQELHIGFIGAGRMATALARGLIAAGVLSAERIVACDPLGDARLRFTEECGAAAVEAAGEVWTRSDVVVLAIKPQHVAEALAEGRPHTGFGHLVISIAAGVRLSSLLSGLGEGVRLVRVMPNTPALVSAGASAFALGGAAGDDDARLVERLFSTVGTVVQLPEHLLDAVTGLSGSGPAYVYQVIEALSDGGVLCGLPRDAATALAAQTVLGAARMVLETGEHPAALKDAVASPGGTTIAGLRELERGGLRSALIAAVEAATRRSQELGGSVRK
ncbi:MAG: pyrroline-5-carboxylate reductase [Planctomycetes bacterium]|nr:pyrroline-5-carboxylate reductase [Planctomycetota bacterium]